MSWRHRPRFVKRKEVWLPTALGWITLTAITILFSVAVGRSLFPFLSVSRPIAADVLVVEGWAPDLVLERALAEFRQGGYQLLVTTGAELSHGRHLAQQLTFAELAGATLTRLGLPPEALLMAPAPRRERQRTKAAATAVRDLLAKRLPGLRAINLYSIGPHARRSWLIYSRVLNPVAVGIIAHPPLAYASERWWATSEGTRSVIGESLAYAYHRIFEN